MDEVEKELTGGQTTGQDLDAEVEAEIAKALGDKTIEELIDESTSPAPVVAKDGPAPAGAQASEQNGEDLDDDDERVRLELKRGRISAIQGDDVFVELSGIDSKHQGIVPLAQFDRPPRIGSIMDFVVDRIDEDEGVVVLSREGAVGRTTWDHLHKGSVVEARVTGTNKGGIELEMAGRIRAFMPASQIDIRHVDDMEQFVGQKLIASVIELNRRSRKVLLSRRRHLEHERELKRGKIWSQTEVGQVVEGVVSSLANYGAFVDLGGVDGLVHVSDMSYSHVDKPEEVLEVGQHVKVKVLKLDKEKERISLGLKQVAPDPWETFSTRVNAGEQLSGRVVRVADFGAFVEVEAGIEGLLPLSEMSWSRVHKPTEVVNVGDVVHVVVLKVEQERRRISLSLKQAGGDPWIGASYKYARDSEAAGKVRSITDFGAFVELEAGVEGMAHISELSQQRVARVEDVVNVGETHTFRVLEVDEDNRRIRLSLKPAGEPASTSHDHGLRKDAARPAARRKPPQKLKGGLE